MVVLSEVFYVCLLTTLSGLLLKIASLAYKSKCRKCSCCGVSIIRDVFLENEYDEAELEKGTLNKGNSEKL